MIITLRVRCLSSEECIRLIEIDSTASILDLHFAIQQSVDFDNSHMFEFFIGRTPRNRTIFVGGKPNWDTFDPFREYENVSLSEVFPLQSGMKLFYLFDFGDSWIFQVTKSPRKDKKAIPDIQYPRVVDTKGENPEQYPEW
ncbi:hypothetical protein KAI46_09940 [bacterium]|nr:hypothetical protein [bacterium]